MNTELMLFARYEKPYVPLEDICMEYFGMCEKRAKLAAASQKLPVPVVRKRLVNPIYPYCHQSAIFKSSDERFIGNRCSTLAPLGS